VCVSGDLFNQLATGIKQTKQLKKRYTKRGALNMRPAIGLELAKVQNDTKVKKTVKVIRSKSEKVVVAAVREGAAETNCRTFETPTLDCRADTLDVS
jgi:hypothetical protein